MEEGVKRKRKLKILFTLVGLFFIFQLIFSHSHGIYFAGTGRLASTFGFALGAATFPLLLPYLFLFTGKAFKKDWFNGFFIFAMSFEVFIFLTTTWREYKFWNLM